MTIFLISPQNICCGYALEGHQIRVMFQLSKTSLRPLLVVADYSKMVPPLHFFFVFFYVSYCNSAVMSCVSLLVSNPFLFFVPPEGYAS